MKLLVELRTSYPDLLFVEGRHFSWSPKDRKITYVSHEADDAAFAHGILHELAHSLLDHASFRHDIELVTMERDAWTMARKLLLEHGIKPDTDHVDQCLNSYRDWLYARSQCPRCGLVGIQTARHNYDCVHCLISWKVPASRLCAVRRKILAP